MLSGPMFAPTQDANFKSIYDKPGSHYNIYKITGGMSALREFFSKGHADEMNFVLFSTSGIHGSYITIEEIEAGLIKYGDDPDFGDDGWPDDYFGNDLTVLIVQPRIVCLRYGDITVRRIDIPFLKTLRETSWAAALSIGRVSDGSPEGGETGTGSITK